MPKKEEEFISPFDKTRIFVLNFIENNEEFGEEELNKAIRKSKNCFVVAPGIRVKDYLDNFVQSGVLERVGFSSKYRHTSVKVREAVREFLKQKKDGGYQFVYREEILYSLRQSHRNLDLVESEVKSALEELAKEMCLHFQDRIVIKENAIVRFCKTDEWGE